MLTYTDDEQIYHEDKDAVKLETRIQCHLKLRLTADLV